MGQDYSCILTREKVSIHRDIPHFKAKSIVNIPLNIEGQSVKEFIEFFDEGRLTIKLIKYPDDDFEYGPCDDVFNILKIITDLGLLHKEFVLLHLSDFADVEVDSFWALFNNGKLVPGTIYLYNRPSGEHVGCYSDLFTYWNINWDMFKRFHDYRDAVREYSRNLL